MFDRRAIDVELIPHAGGILPVEDVKAVRRQPEPDPVCAEMFVIDVSEFCQRITATERSFP